MVDAFCFHPPEQRQDIVGATVALLGQDKTPSGDRRQFLPLCCWCAGDISVHRLPPSSPGTSWASGSPQGEKSRLGGCLGSVDSPQWAPLPIDKPGNGSKHSCPDSWAPWPIWAFCSWGVDWGLSRETVCREKMLAGLVQGIVEAAEPQICREEGLVETQVANGQCQV